MSKCIDPVLCYDNGSSRKFCHFSLASPLIKALHNKVFNCGKCVFCRKRRASELAMRCVLHASLSPYNCFLTLTYDETREGYHNNFVYKDIQDFKKRLRSYVAYQRCRSTPLCKFGKAQIFNVHEYGKNRKKHWHLVCFNWDFSDKVFHTSNGGHVLYKSDTLSDLWSHGFCTIGDVSLGSAMYTAQYVQKDLKHGHSANEFRSHSKHSGIGKEYFLAHYDQILRLGYVPFGGQRVPVPRYFIKLAHKHWSHFFEPENFFDTRERKRLYTPFKSGEANESIADAFVIFRNIREQVLRDVEREWSDFISRNWFNDSRTDFQKSGDNYLYDLQNKISIDRF